MTVTRHQADQSDNSLVHRNAGSLTTQKQSSAPLWAGVILQIAQDKRHDLTEGVIRLWKEKLKKWSDEAICEALVTGKWELFPSVDQVITQIEANQQRRRQESADRDWISYKANQLKAEMEGRLATEEDYAYMRRRVRELFAEPKVSGSTASSLKGTFRSGPGRGLPERESE